MPQHRVDLALVLCRLLIAYVYLYAAFLNAKSDNRGWLIEHTAMLFPPSTSRAFSAAAASVGVAMMFLGGASILLGVATWLGASTLGVFTLLGYQQHRKEVEFATDVANALAAELDPILGNTGSPKDARGHMLNLRVSAISGQLSSGLKNWGLLGALILLGLLGSGSYSLDRALAIGRPNRFIDFIIWPM